jgi:hypothetical protein
MTSQHGTQSVKTHDRTTQTTKEMGNTNPTKNGVNSGDRERQAASASDKTLAILLISTVKSSNSHGSDKGKKTST